MQILKRDSGGIRLAIAASIAVLVALAGCTDPEDSGGESEPGDDVVVDDVEFDAASDVESDEGACEDGDGTFAVSDVQGEIEEGAEIVVCGDEFGDQGPETVFFDDFEDGEPGESLDEEGPVVGEWYTPGGPVVDDESRSGSNSLLLLDHEESTQTSVFAIPDEEGRFGLRHFDEFFMHWSLKDLGDFPGNDSSPTDFSSDSSVKDIWVMFGDRGDNYDYSCSQGECNGNDIVLASHTGGGGFKHDGNNTRSDWWISDFWQFEAWNRMSFHLRLDDDDPYGDATGDFEHFSEEGGYFQDDYEGPMMREELDEIPPVWDRIKVGAWYRGAGETRRIADDIYIAIGDGAAARVEVADAETIEEATNIAVATVDDWSKERLEATLRLGDLDPGDDDLHLFVVDADNRRTPGFALNQLN